MSYACIHMIRSASGSVSLDWHKKGYCLLFVVVIRRSSGPRVSGSRDSGSRGSGPRGSSPRVSRVGWLGD